MTPSWYTPPPYGAYSGLEVISKVARLHGLTASDLLGKNRSRPVSQVRWRAMKALRERGLTHSAIGRLLKCDQSSVWHGLRKVGAS